MVRGGEGVGRASFEVGEGNLGWKHAGRRYADVASEDLFLANWLDEPSLLVSNSP
jgi:hypothetical protein